MKWRKDFRIVAKNEADVFAVKYRLEKILEKGEIAKVLIKRRKKEPLFI